MPWSCTGPGAFFVPPGGACHPYMILKMVLCAHVPHKTPEALGRNGFEVGTLQFIMCPEVPHVPRRQLETERPPTQQG